MTFRVLIIDDHAMFRSGLALLLRMSFANVAVTETGGLADALKCDMEAPDVVLLDIQLHGLNGLDGLPLVKRKWPLVPVIVMSSDTAPETEARATLQGAAAFVSKEQTADEMLSAIRSVFSGDQSPAAAPLSTAPAAERLMTPRQYEVLDLICQGLSNKAIARQLDLSENTVRGHVQAILTALEVANRGEAACVARRKGLIR